MHDTVIATEEPLICGQPIQIGRHIFVIVEVLTRETFEKICTENAKLDLKGEYSWEAPIYNGKVNLNAAEFTTPPPHTPSMNYFALEAIGE